MCIGVGAGLALAGPLFHFNDIHNISYKYYIKTIKLLVLPERVFCELHKFLTSSLLERKMVNAPWVLLYGCKVRNHTLTSFDNAFVHRRSSHESTCTAQRAKSNVVKLKRVPDLRQNRTLILILTSGCVLWIINFAGPLLGGFLCLCVLLVAILPVGG